MVNVKLDDGYPTSPGTYESLLSGLTEVQRRIAHLSPDARILVTAGAGTGKTHLLVARVAALIREHDLSPGQDILVLSFTRAAVRAVKERLRVAGGTVGHVGISTFDSYATRLLATIRPTGAWQEQSFDGRITAAVEAISQGEADDHLGQVRHLLVDEVQDLVGIRAELVESMLARVLGGFTLLGDPAQGIFNWSLEDQARQEGSAALYRWVRERFRDSLEEATLGKNFRAISETARSALWAGAELNAEEPDYEDIHDRLEDLIAELPTLGNIKAAAEGLALLSREPTAVLCRSNAEALKLSRALLEAGVPHRLQRRPSARAVAPWVAKAVGQSQTKTLGRAAFERNIAEISDPSLPEPETAWSLAKRLAGASGDTLDLGRLGERVRTGLIPDELNWTPPSWLVLSTIHRAKGLEFDRVVILGDGQEAGPEDEIELAEETRVLYVALTRPRLDMLRANRPRTYGFKCDGHADRWYREGKQRWQVHDIELRGEDTHSMDPAGGFLVHDQNPAALQVYIGEKIQSGDEVALVQRSTVTGDSKRVFYEIRHAGITVGVTSEQFGSGLFSILHSHWKKFSWPSEIEGLTVEGIDTVAGSAVAGEKAGLGPSGLWLRVRIAGLGFLRFPKKQ